MQKELECTKIKDGLYLGNIKTAQDAQFLLTNKLTYIINCSAQISNYYQGQGIKYLKFKLSKQKPHKLWDETLKKLKKLDQFIQTCEENSMCCLFHSYDGVNRSLVMLVAFLMNRYRWTLGKTLEFVRSKEIFIGLSEHYIQQLEILETILMDAQPNLTSEWRIDYKTPQQQIISKTFLNSQQIEYKQPTKRQKKQKRVVWKDLLQKQKKKQQKMLIKQQQKQRGLKLTGELEERTMIDLTKLEQKEVGLKVEPKRSKVQQGQAGKESKEKASFKKLKILGNRSKPEILLHQSEKNLQRSVDKYREKERQKQKQKQKEKEKERVKQRAKAQSKDEEQPALDEDQILKLIKNNLKSKKKLEQTTFLNPVTDSQQRIYNVTINNYIKPNINILNANAIGEKKKTKKRPQSAWKKNKPL